MEPIMTADALKKLAKAVGKADSGDPFDNGDVIRWTVNGIYTYAALRAAGKWWITGTSAHYPHGGVGYDRLVKVLAEVGASDIQHANGWSDPIKETLPIPDFTPPPGIGPSQEALEAVDRTVRTKMSAERSRGHERACRYSGLKFSEAPWEAEDCCCRYPSDQDL